MTCSRCGAANGREARFCSRCGAALEVEPAAPGRSTRKVVTILFADVAGSTALGELLDPEAVRALMDRYFALMRRVIESHGGTVEKFIGDAVMAVFGIPVVHEDDALRAVRAADEIRAALETGDLFAAGDQPVRFRTGINTGEVFAGDPGGGQAFVTGDAVNTAARLEQAASPGEILLGRPTWRLVRDAVSVEPVDPISAKGKADPLSAYRLLALDPGIAGHHRGHEALLVGRERELAALTDAFDQVASGRVCQLVTLLGTAGAGKSRLVAEFATSADRDATVLRGRCLSYGEGITYWPIGEIVRAAAGIGETDSADVARTKLRARLDGEPEADAIAARLASAIGLSTDPAPQEEVFWAIRKLWEHLARERPLIVIIEDIHWAEPTLLDLIEHIVDYTRDRPIVLLCPARPELLAVREGWPGQRSAVTMLLEPLGTDAIGRLIAALPGGSALPPQIVTGIMAAAEGNPLFIEEFLGMLVDDGRLVEAPDGSWSVAADLGEVHIPASISALLTARLERLAPAERSVVARASVVGRVFEGAAVAELTDDPSEAEVTTSLLELVRKELILRDDTELTAGDAFKFRHILIRDAAYGALPKAERTVLHLRFADWLERTVGERVAEYPEILGYHLEQAHRYRAELGEAGVSMAHLAGRAGAYLSTAGVRASERGDLSSAIGLFRRALPLTPEGHDRIELLINLRSTLRATGDRDEADVADAEAVALLAEYPDEGLEHHYRLTDAMLDFEGSSQEGREAFAYYERIGDAAGMMRALQVLFWDHALKGRFTAAVEVLDSAYELAVALERVDLAAGFVSNAAPSFVDSPLPVSEALDRCRVYLDLVGDDRQAQVMVLLAIGGLEAMTGVRDTWRRPFEAAKSIIDDLGLIVPLGAATYPVNLADAELAAGDPARVVDILRASCSMLGRLGVASLLSSLAPLTGQTLLALGQLDEVERYAMWGRELAAPDDLDANARWRNVMSGLRSTQGHHREAIALAQESVSIMTASEFMDSRLTGQMVLARALRAAGDEAGAVEAAQAARVLATGKQNRTALRTISVFLGR